MLLAPNSTASSSHAPYFLSLLHNSTHQQLYAWKLTNTNEEWNLWHVNVDDTPNRNQHKNNRLRWQSSSGCWFYNELKSKMQRTECLQAGLAEEQNQTWGNLERNSHWTFIINSQSDTNTQKTHCCSLSPSNQFQHKSARILQSVRQKIDLNIKAVGRLPLVVQFIPN